MFPCPSCGSDTPNGARFCPTCGHLLVETEERRVVTVLFVDLVGFTKLSEDADPEDIKHLIDTCFQRLVADVGAFGGTVDKIIGDAILALFGAPIAHEDDSERALRAAFRMRDSLAKFSNERGIKLQMRAGISTGEVLVGALHAGGDYTVMGDTVNIANRLQSMANPGEVLVGSLTQAATASVVQFEGRGELKLRGRNEPVGVFAACGELAPPGRRRNSNRAPLVGRSLELQQLTSAINTALSRRRAQLVQIVGEAGLGKSRLAEEVTAKIEEEHGALVLSSMVLPYDETNPLRALGAAIASTAGAVHSDSTEVVGERVTKLITEALLAVPSDSTEVVGELASGVSQKSDRESKIADTAQMVLAMLGRVHDRGVTGSTQVATLSSPTELDGHTGEVHSAMTGLFGALERIQPIVLVIGDIHWADERLLCLLESLLAALASQRFVVLATARWAVDEEHWTVPLGRHNTVVLNLDPLDIFATAELANSLLGFEAPQELVDQLHARSGGNPFFLEEISTLLRDAGVVAAEVNADQAARPLDDLPDTLRGLVAARLDGLTDDERKMVDDAAVLGGSGGFEDLLTVFGLGITEGQDQTGVAGVEQAETIFQQLIDKDIFSVEERTWRFRSDLVSEVAYARLTKNERSQRHIRVAEWIAIGIDEKSPEYVPMIANHLATAIELGGNSNRDAPWSTTLGVSVIDAAVEWLTRAADDASARESHFAADQLYRRAIELIGNDDERLIDMSLGRATARLGLGELSGARADAESARSLALLKGDREAAAHGLVLLGRIALITDDHAQAEMLLAEASGHFQALGDVREAAEALRLRGFALLRAGDHSRADRYINEAHATFVHLKDETGIAWCLQSLAWLSFEQGLLEEAEERLKLAIETFSEEGNSSGLATALGLQAFLLFHAGQRTAAEKMANEVREIVHEKGERFTEAMMDLLLGSLGMWSGHAADALERARSAEQVFTQIGSAYGVVQALGLQGRAYVALGEVQRSRAVLTECWQRAMKMPGKPLERFAHAVRAGGNVQIGNPRAALEDIKNMAGTDAHHGPLVIGTLELGVSEGLALLQLGQVDAAIKTLEKVDEIRGDKVPSMYLDSSLALAYCAAEKTTEVHERAKAVLDAEAGTYLDVRTALLAQALAYARDGDRQQMDEAFGKALTAINETDSRFSQAVVRLAMSVGHKAIESLQVAEMEEKTEAALRTLDARPTGWETAFCVAVGLEPPHTEDGPLPEAMPYQGE